MALDGFRLNESALAGQITRLREVDNVTNLAYLANEYLGIAAVIGGTILLFPGVPHHRSSPLHRLLKERHPEYAARVVECRGTFANREGLPTILDVLAGPRPTSSIEARR